jgi:hypothetical protein
MKIKQWYERIPQINTYHPERDGIPNNILLSKRLSPLTNLFLNVFFNTLDGKNLIYAVPATVLRPIPIISYLYSSTEDKSVIVFTQKSGVYIRDNPAIEHNRNYHLLNSGDYLFSKIPIGFIADSSVDAKVYLPRAIRRVKRQYIQHQKENFLKSDGARILLHYDENNSRISNFIEKITLDNEKLDNININIDIGLVIFENVDRFAHSSYSSQIFLKWISSLLEKGVRTLFHFSNPLSKYIQVIKEYTDSYVLQFGPSLLRYNEELKKASLSYFNSKSIPTEEKRFIDKYNIDRPFFYTGITEIELLAPPLSSGNIDEYYRRGMSLRSKINEGELVNKRAYYSLINLLFQLHNLSINPSKYKGPFHDPDIGYRTYTIPHMIAKLKEHISDEKTQDEIYLKDLISEIYCLYLELKECKRYGENAAYSRIAKDYQMLKLLNENINQERGEAHIVLATYSRMGTERTILKTETEKWGFENGFNIEYIGRLSRQSFDRTKTTLILPGPLRLKHIPELLKPYRKIIMITYDGKNYEIGKDQIDLVYTYSQQREDRAMCYLEEIYTDIGLPKNGLFRDYYDRKSEPQEEKAEVTIEEPETDAGEDPMLVRIKKLLIARNSQISKDFLQEDEDADRIEQRITEILQEDDIRQIEESNEYYRVTLEKFDESTRVDRNLPINKSYLYLKDMDDKVQEGYPTDFKIDNYMVLIGNDERRTFLDTIIEIFGLEDSINKRLLTMWKEKLRDFIDKQGLSYAQGHRLFKENGGTISYPEFLNWAKGNVIGPDDPNDLVILGKMMDEEELIENYELINQEVEDLRNIHKITGRRVRKIIKEILRGELNQSELSFEEYMLYEQIHNNIYRIVDIKRMVRKEEESNENPSG